MPRLIDLAIVRSLLDRDRAWAAYAIGDLAPGYVEDCEWYATPDHSTALLLLYRGFNPPIVFATGPTDAIRRLLAEIDPPEISLHVRQEGIDAVRHTYTVTELRTMRRMFLSREAFTPVAQDEVQIIRGEDTDAVLALYADGAGQGEAPTFFHPAMLRQGTFRGVWEAAALVAIAGTHLYSAELGVCAIGNVYTRRDRRGRGLAARVTSAVVSHALADRVPTVVLNVAEHNTRAQRVYERLGFVPYVEFFEGHATREP
jgi:ribosomal protein S18 acetylase RimI-like enzyme